MRMADNDGFSTNIVFQPCNPTRQQNHATRQLGDGNNLNHYSISPSHCYCRCEFQTNYLELPQNIHELKTTSHTDSYSCFLVQTIFGSQFFGLDNSTSPPKFRMSNEFWIFWVIVVGVTIAVYWVRREVKRRREGRQGVMAKRRNCATQWLEKIRVLNRITLQRGRNTVYGNTF